MLSFAASPPAVIEAVLSARQEVRARAVLDRPSPAALDTETALTASLEHRARSLRTWITYGPRLTARDFGIAPTALFLHTGTVGFSKSFPRVTLTLREDGTFGSQNFGGAAIATSLTTTQPVVNRVPLSANLDVMSLQTSLLANYVPNREWALASYAIYATSGGTNDESRLFFPREYGPRAGIDARYAVTRRDGFLTSATYALAASSTGAQSTIATFALGWARTASPRTTASLVAGVALTRTRPNATSARATDAQPVASATLGHKPMSGRTTGRYTATVSLGPVVDRLTGRVTLRVDGSLNGTWPIAPRFVVQALGGAGRSSGSEDGVLPPITLFTAEATLGHTPWRWLRVDGGVRASYQSSSAVSSPAGAAVPIGPTSTPATLSASQVTVFVALTVTDTVRLLP
jgi:hypothetical protein